MGRDSADRPDSVERPLWDEFEVWLKLQRMQVLDGSKIAEAIDYSLNAWKALTLHLEDGAVAIDNNLIERQIKPWKLGAKNWLFVGSELAGPARGRGDEPGAIGQAQRPGSVGLPARRAGAHPLHPNNRIEELLPHRWRPS
jgi:transposase